MGFPVSWPFHRGGIPRGIAPASKIGRRKSNAARKLKGCGPRKDRDEIREEALRPSPHLGYNWHGIGLYFMEREAWKLAEAQFRRAIWLNPYEAMFQAHLAWCLLYQNRLAEAGDWISKALAKKPDSEEFQRLRRAIEDRIERSRSPSATGETELGREPSR